MPKKRYIRYSVPLEQIIYCDSNVITFGMDNTISFNSIALLRMLFLILLLFLLLSIDIYNFQNNCIINLAITILQDDLTDEEEY